MRFTGSFRFYFLLAAVLLLVPPAHAVDIPLGPSQPCTVGWEPNFSFDLSQPMSMVLANGSVFLSSVDGGATFPVTTYSPAAAGDGIVAIDSQNRAFWTYLLNNPWETAVEQINPATGAVVGSQYIFPYQIDSGGVTVRDDKAWIAADANPGSSYKDSVYLVWSLNRTGSQLVFSRSRNQGVTWSTPVTITPLSDQAWSGHIAVGANGNIYIAYRDSKSGAVSDTINVITSTNGGDDLLAGNVSTAQAISSIPLLPAQLTGSSGVTGIDFWLLGQRVPYVLPDPSNAQNVYVIANSPNGSNPGDVYFASNQGSGWSSTQILSNPNPTTSFRFFPMGAVDSTGTIVVAWYDTYPGTLNTSNLYELNVYGTLSHDGGRSWVRDFRINQNTYSPTTITTRIGEYMGLGAANGTAYADWLGAHNAALNEDGNLIAFPVLASSVQSVHPDAGLFTGGTPVTITGDNFTTLGPPTTVLFGLRPASNVQVASASTLYATSPPGTPGSTVDVTVHDYKGDSAVTFTDHYSYFYYPGVPLLTSQGGCQKGAVEARVTGPTGRPLSGQRIRFVVNPSPSSNGPATFNRTTDPLGKAVLDLSGWASIQLPVQVAVAAVNLSSPVLQHTRPSQTRFTVDSMSACYHIPVSIIYSWGPQGPFQGEIPGIGGIPPATCYICPPNPCEVCGPNEEGWATDINGPVESSFQVVAQFGDAETKTQWASQLNPVLYSNQEQEAFMKRNNQLEMDGKAGFVNATFVGAVCGFKDVPSAEFKKVSLTTEISVPYDPRLVKGNRQLRVVRLESGGGTNRWTDEGVLTLGAEKNAVRAVYDGVGLFTVVAVAPIPQAETEEDDHGGVGLKK